MDEQTNLNKDAVAAVEFEGQQGDMGRQLIINLTLTVRMQEKLGMCCWQEERQKAACQAGIGHW